MNKQTQTYSGSQSSQITKRELEHRSIARRAAAEGMVLLENNGILPLKKGSKLAVYGGGASYTIKGGTGSGAVNNRDTVSITQGLRNAGFQITTENWLADYENKYEKAREDWMNYIYSISTKGDFMSLYVAHASNPLQLPKGMDITPTDTDTALYVISRISGEGADRKLEKGDYYLNDTETEELQAIHKHYKNIIVILNVGGVIDTSFVKEYSVSALLLMSQAGMEGGNALADILLASVNPSGKLTATWANQYDDYPCSTTFSYLNGNIYEEKYTEGIYVGYRYFDTFGIPAKYPFGYGLSYTSFSIEPLSAELTSGYLHAKVRVTNTGTCAGKETVFFYSSNPQGLLKKEQRRLVGFEKTPLLQPGETIVLESSINLHLLESYHTGHSTYYMEAGDYYIFTNTLPLTTLHLECTRKMMVTEEICPLLDALREIEPTEELITTWRTSYKEMFMNIPSLELDRFLQGYITEPVPENKQSLQAQAIRKKLSLEEKATLCCGKQNTANGEFIGNASTKVPGAAGETTTILTEEYGIENIVMADGPAGIRILQSYNVNPENGEVYRLSPIQSLENRIFGKVFDFEGAVKYYQFCTAIPIGTLLAQSFDLKLLEEVGEMIGKEMEEYHLRLWLAPGMNIHRNPLCGRNFEYYSEDPLVSGRMAAAITKGVQKKKGLGTTIKHFACNNQEDNRRGVNSIVSERALREIYLKGFEIAIRESQPLAIMTSYNKINGVHAANNKDICTQAARKEWGFQGIIMTDWTTTNADGGSSAAKCIAAGNDLIMPGNHRDIQEIIDAVNRTGTQKINERDLDACCDRLLLLHLI